MSATHSWFGPSALNSRSTRSGAARCRWSRCVVTTKPRRRLTSRMALARISRATREAVDLHPLIDQLGTQIWHAVGRIRLGMNGANSLDPHGVHRSPGRRSLEPSVVAAGRDAKHAAHPIHSSFGLVRVHEFVDPMDVLSPLPANQAVAFARMSRSCLTLRFSRRSRTSSSRSVLVIESLLRAGLPLSAAACATQVEMLWTLQPNSRASCVGERPACTSLTICRRNSAGYQGFGKGMSDSFFHRIRCPRNGSNS